MALSAKTAELEGSRREARALAAALGARTGTSSPGRGVKASTRRASALSALSAVLSLLLLLLLLPFCLDVVPKPFLFASTGWLSAVVLPFIAGKTEAPRIFLLYLARSALHRAKVPICWRP